MRTRVVNDPRTKEESKEPSQLHQDKEIEDNENVSETRGRDEGHI